MNVTVALLISTIVCGLGVSFEAYRLASVKEELNETKENLYDCLERNKTNETTINEIEKNNKLVKANLDEAQNKYIEATAKENHKITEILKAVVPDNCAKAIQWGAKKSAGIAKNYNIDQH